MWGNCSHAYFYCSSRSRFVMTCLSMYILSIISIHWHFLVSFRQTKHKIKLRHQACAFHDRNQHELMFCSKCNWIWYLNSQFNHNILTEVYANKHNIPIISFPFPILNIDRIKMLFLFKTILITFGIVRLWFPMKNGSSNLALPDCYMISDFVKWYKACIKL
jgi:hypothetical protein